MAKISVRVIDQNGDPVEGATVDIGFELAKLSWQGAGIILNGVKGITDGEGIFSGSGESSASISISVRKKGYYNTYSAFNGYEHTTGFCRWYVHKPQFNATSQNALIYSSGSTSA